MGQASERGYWQISKWWLVTAGFNQGRKVETLAPKAGIGYRRAVHGKNKGGQSHWIELDKKMAIQGFLAERKKEQRVYVVTIDTPLEHAWIHDRWPRLVRLNDS